MAIAALEPTVGKKEELYLLKKKDAYARVPHRARSIDRPILTHTHTPTHTCRSTYSQVALLKYSV